MEDKLQIKLSAILDNDSKNELRELIKVLVKEEVEKVAKPQYIPYPIPYYPIYSYSPIYTDSSKPITYETTITCKTDK